VDKVREATRILKEIGEHLISLGYQVVAHYKEALDNAIVVVFPGNHQLSGTSDTNDFQ